MTKKHHILTIVKQLFSWLMRYVLPWGITVWLLIWLLHKVNFHQVMQIISHGCNFWWIALMMFISALSLVVRGVRWDMQLQEVGTPKMPVIVDSCALFGAYALNLVFPRLGEAWRCLYVSRHQKCPFMTVVGTDFGDRTSDLICVFVSIILALVLDPSHMHLFFKHYAVGHVIDEFFSSYWTWCAAAVCIGGIWALLYFWGNVAWVKKLHAQLMNVWQGFVALFKVKPLSKYLWLTLALWTCIFLETYVCFFSFSFTREMVAQPGTAWGLLPGLLCLVFGTCSTIIPSNGGLGPWTIAIAYALELYGIRAVDAAAYALLVWGMQAVIFIALGIFAFFYTRHITSPASSSALK